MTSGAQNAPERRGGHSKPLSDRAKSRLKLAASFLRSAGHQFPPNGDFYGQVVDKLAMMSDHDRAMLKECVDWVEDYNRAEAQTTGEKRR